MRYKCEHCGAYLDPGEHCDCLEQKERVVQKIMDMMLLSDDGQYAINVGGSYGFEKL